jgi:hypothetical protein
MGEEHNHKVDDELQRTSTRLKAGKQNKAGDFSAVIEDCHLLHTTVIQQHRGLW